jgi:hypothetical protein
MLLSCKYGTRLVKKDLEQLQVHIIRGHMEYS